MFGELPVPEFFDPDRVGQVWRVPYQERAEQAVKWRNTHRIPPAGSDEVKIALVLVDVQNTFCLPDFELFVAGRSGRGAVEDNVRLCRFIYRNLANLTEIIPTLDTHQAIQIFHAIFLVNERGEHPQPYTLVSVEDVEQGKWRFNPAVAPVLGLDAESGQKHLLHYTRQLKAQGKYQLTIWPYHAMLGGIGHALVSSVEEALFFHGICRYTQPRFQIKGNHPLTENYSALGPEVKTGADGRTLAEKNHALIEHLLQFDAVIFTGQAKSHCVAWTVEDFLNDQRVKERDFARRVYLLEDCTSPVVVPGAIDYSEEADRAFERFARLGAHRVTSEMPLSEWPDLKDVLKK
ncbi:MAG: isochorismatase [Calditrichaeota bacterium]|nr:MAG: isochorismatase [Calditrichota bacterium]